MSNPYISRTFEIPSGFSFLPVNTNQYTDAVINNLYVRFSACYASRMYNIASAAKMGCKSEMDSESKYLLMALYILRNWYNPNPYSFVVFSLNNIQTGTQAQYNTVNLYIVPTNGSQSVSQLLDTTTNYSSGSVAYNGLIINAPNYILGQKGWTLQFVSPDTFILTPPLGYTGNSYIWVNEINNGSQYSVVNQWLLMQSINPCLSADTIQDIIETCIGICGNMNCTNSKTLLQDNNFVSLGQTFIPPSDVLTNLFPNPYFL